MGRYVTNKEFAEINRALKTKNRRNFGCGGSLFVVGIFLLGIFWGFGIGDFGKENPTSPLSVPAPAPAPAVVPAADGSSAVKTREPLKIVNAMRVWEDMNGKKVKGRFLERRGEKVTLRIGKNKKTFDYEKFSEKDRRFLDALETFDESSVTVNDFELRTWNPWDLPQFDARLIDAAPNWILLERDGKFELYSRRDFSVPDLLYFDSIGWTDRINGKK